MRAHEHQLALGKPVYNFKGHFEFTLQQTTSCHEIKPQCSISQILWMCMHCIPKLLHLINFFIGFSFVKTEKRKPYFSGPKSFIFYTAVIWLYKYFLQMASTIKKGTLLLGITASYHSSLWPWAVMMFCKSHLFCVIWTAC